MNIKSPKISILLATKNSVEEISLCLESIEKQNDFSANRGIEVIIAAASSDQVKSTIVNRFPWVKIIHCDLEASSADLKRKAILESRGEIIVMTEPHCIVDERWISSILKSHDSSYAVISGAVEPFELLRLRDWAAFFCEYSPFILPLKKGKYPEMAGNNISYKRETLSKYFSSISKEGFWKAFIQSKMTENKESMITDPNIIVYHKKKVDFFPMLCKRYYFGRCFGGMRGERMKKTKKIFYALFSPAIPLLFLTRSIRSVVPKKRYLKEYFLSSPLLVLLFIAWAYGEFCGYIRGKGNSCREVYY